MSFSRFKHCNLSKKNNHKIVEIDGEWMWFRKHDYKTWERSMIDKEFKDYYDVKRLVDYAIKEHTYECKKTIVVNDGRCRTGELI